MGLTGRFFFDERILCVTFLAAAVWEATSNRETVRFAGRGVYGFSLSVVWTGLGWGIPGMVVTLLRGEPRTAGCASQYGSKPHKLHSQNIFPLSFWSLVGLAALTTGFEPMINSANAHKTISESVFGYFMMKPPT